MNRVHASAEDLERFARRLRAIQEEVDRFNRELEQTLDTIDWRDAVKDRIDADVRQAIGGMRRFSVSLGEHARQVDGKARTLREFLR